MMTKLEELLEAALDVAADAADAFEPIDAAAHADVGAAFAAYCDELKKINGEL